MAINPNGNWQPQNLRQRSRAALYAPPPAGRAPMFNGNGEEIGTTGGLIPGGMRLPPAPDMGPGVPISPPPTGGIPRGMGAPAVASGYGGAGLLPPVMATGELPRSAGLPALPSMPLNTSGPIFDAPSSVPGASNYDARMRPPPATLTSLLTNPTSFAPGAVRVPGNTGAAPGDMPPGWDPASRTLSQTTTPPPAGVMPPAVDPVVFQSEAARRAITEGKDPAAAAKAAALVRPAGSRVGQTREIDGVKYVYTQEGNLSPLAKDKPVQQTVDVGGRKLTVGPGDKYFDDTGKPVLFSADRPPTAPPFELKQSDPELYEAMRSQFLDHVSEKKTAAGGAKPITPAQAAKLPKGTKFIGEDGKERVARGPSVK